MFTIDNSKLKKVTRIIKKKHPKATETLLFAEICADWNEGEEHQQWLDTATAEEIADWLASFYG